MITRLHHAALFALYQTTLVLGLCLLPLAVAMKRVGFVLPVRRLLVTAERIYEAHAPTERTVE